jgi:hypothetical protein
VSVGAGVVGTGVSVGAGVVGTGVSVAGGGHGGDAGSVDGAVKNGV